MIIKGVSEIRGIRGLNTKAGRISEANAYLELYQLATEKDHLMKKLQWVGWQKNQTERRLSEIARTIHVVEKRARRALTSTPHSEFRSRFIEY
jgi:hypothetical protein